MNNTTIEVNTVYEEPKVNVGVITIAVIVGLLISSVCIAIIVCAIYKSMKKKTE